MNYSALSQHQATQQIADFMFMVHGSVRLKPFGQVYRNLAIVRHEGELAVVYPLLSAHSTLLEHEAKSAARQAFVFAFPKRNSTP
jgi:hypothetical protein